MPNRGNGHNVSARGNEGEIFVLPIFLEVLY